MVPGQVRKIHLITTDEIRSSNLRFTAGFFGGTSSFFGSYRLKILTMLGLFWVLGKGKFCLRALLVDTVNFHIAKLWS